MIHGQIDVALGDRSYPIYIGTNSVESFSLLCRQHGTPDSVVLITDRNIAQYHLKPLVKSLVRHKFHVTSIVVPPGEVQKSLHGTNEIYTKMLERRISRNSIVIAFGGGVVGDLSGFVAATYQRGIKLIQVPTTLLAQVDSSVGGKVGINHPLGKNMIGAFYQPLFVWMDIDYLKTLPQREIVCGMGEIIKYGIIRDEELFTFLESRLTDILQLDLQVLIRVLKTCVAIKSQVVAEDEKESGVRIILNCGHTVGHGLESAGHFRLLKHGEAVLLGLLTESLIAKNLGLLDKASYDRILSLIQRLPIKTKFSSLKMIDIVNAMHRDKKRVGPKIRFVLPTKIGAVKVVEEVNLQLVRSAVREVIKTHR